MLNSLFFLFSTHSILALTTLTVSTDTDNNPGGNGQIGDLRYCLNTMNQNLQSSTDDYAIVFNRPMTIYLNGILPIINNSSNSVSISIGNSDSTSVVTLDGQDTYRGFFIATGTVTIQNMNFINMRAQGGYGGDGISGGGGGMGAGGAIYAPSLFFNNSNPLITLMNVSTNNCSAIGGNGGNYISSFSLTGNEGGGGGGGLGGDGGSITTTGNTGGGGGGGFGGNGGNVTTSTGGGGGGGGIGARANTGPVLNSGDGGSDDQNGSDGNGYGLYPAGGSSGGNTGGNQAGGGAGGNPQGGAVNPTGGGGGSSLGTEGANGLGTIPPGGSAISSGGIGADGGGGGGGGIVSFDTLANSIDGKGGSGGYCGGGGGGAGIGSYDTGYSIQGGNGGVGGGGGGGGPNVSSLSANGGNSQGGGGGGGGPSISTPGSGGSDSGQLGGGSGGAGSNTNTGGGGGGGSGLGGAIFVDSNLNFIIKALSGIPTTFNTLNGTVQAGNGGNGGSGSEPGTSGSALGSSIFLRQGSSVTLLAEDVNDILTIGAGVSFVDDTSFGASLSTSIAVQGNGTIIYNGISDYQGSLRINNAHFKVNGQINTADISVCRNRLYSLQRGKLSGSGVVTGPVFVNSGIISPDTNSTLSLGRLTLSPANPTSSTLGSLVHIEIDSGGSSLVSVNGTASLAGALEMDIQTNATIGSYTILSSSGIIGLFDSVTFTGTTPSYELLYLPNNNPTFVRFNFLGYPTDVAPPSNFQGMQKKNDFGLEYELYNQMRWTPSPSANITSYSIYRDGNKIATVDGSTRTYNDHNRKKNMSYTYAITASNATGTESSAVMIVINP